MDRRYRIHWRRARRSYYDLCPPIGRRAATALLWLSCSIALLRALASSNARAQQRAAAQRRTFLNAHHRSSTPVIPESPNSESDQEEVEQAQSPCHDFENDFDYVSESESDIESDFDFDTETETAPTTEPETEPEDERGPRPVVTNQLTFDQSLTERLQALRLRSPDASPSRGQPNTQEPRSPREGEEPKPEDRNPPKAPKPKRKLRFGCKPFKKTTRRDPSPESPPRRGPIPIRRV